MKSTKKIIVQTLFFAIFLLGEGCTQTNNVDITSQEKLKSIIFTRSSMLRRDSLVVTSNFPIFYSGSYSVQNKIFQIDTLITDEDFSFQCINKFSKPEYWKDTTYLDTNYHSEIVISKILIENKDGKKKSIVFLDFIPPNFLEDVNLFTNFIKQIKFLYYEKI